MCFTDTSKSLTDQAKIRKYKHEPLSHESIYAESLTHTFITKYLISYYGINYDTIKVTSISNLFHGTNHYHLVRLYNDTFSDNREGRGCSECE